MSSQKESTVRTLTVAVLVCLVCSVFVAGAAIALKPTQVENRLLDKQRSILALSLIHISMCIRDRAHANHGIEVALDGVKAVQGRPQACLLYTSRCV